MAGFAQYDVLRKSPTASFRPVREAPPSVGRVLHISSDSNNSFTLCHVPIFLRYSLLEGLDYVDVSSTSYGGTAGALLAMHHFNTGDGSIVKELEGIHEKCNIRLTTEVFDTQSSQIVAVQKLAELITLRDEFDIQHPQPCAVMGAAWFDVSQSMATLTGVYDILQVSPSSSSMSLDSVSKYPLFSRTHPSDEAKGRAAVEYFEKILGIKNFGILFIDNELGIALQKSVLDAAKERNMTARSVSFPADVNSPASLRNSLLQLKESRFNYFLGVFFPVKYDHVMDVAAEVGLAGPDKFWLLTGHLADEFAGGNTTIGLGSNAAIGLTGVGILHDDGEPGLPQYEKFLKQWKTIQYNQEAIDYINSKQPEPPGGTNMTFGRSREYFERRPSHYATFSYDAIAGMGIAACVAANRSSLPDKYFTGKDHHKIFTSNPFIGATGNVSFADDSFSRDGNSINYFVTSLEEISRDVSSQKLTVSGVTSMYFDTVSRQWLRFPGARPFQYADFTTTPPVELPPYSEQMNLLKAPVRIACLVLAAAAMLASVGLLLFVFLKRKNGVITASQPPFLYILCVGTFIMASAIIPLTIDDTIVSESGCSIACISRFWLSSIGFTVIFSALFSKAWRINKLVSTSRRFQRIKLNAVDVVFPFLVLFVSNLVVLSLWTVLAPPLWHRQELGRDQFGRQTVSVGRCNFSGERPSLPYGIALFFVNGTALLMAVSEAYKARYIEAEFSDSKYVGMAVVCIFQAMFFGAPLFFLVSNWPSAMTFVASAVIFVICMAVLLLTFLPKIGLMTKKQPQSSSVTVNSSGGLEEGVWNSTSPERVTRLLSEARQQIQLLQRENENLRCSTDGAQRDTAVLDLVPDTEV